MTRILGIGGKIHPWETQTIFYIYVYRYMCNVCNALFLVGGLDPPKGFWVLLRDLDCASFTLSFTLWVQLSYHGGNRGLYYALRNWDVPGIMNTWIIYWYVIGTLLTLWLGKAIGTRQDGHNRRIGGWVEIVGSATSITCILQLDMLRDKGRKKYPSYRPFSTGDL